MADIQALRRVIQEIELRGQRPDDRDTDASTRLTRDLTRARLYLQAAERGYADLILDRLYQDLLEQYGTDVIA